MGKVKDLTNQRFGRLVAKKMLGINRKRSMVWECVCDCGNIVEVPSYDLLREHKKSCGCLKETYKFKHGYSDHPLYDCWVAMKSRCINETAQNYKNYGNRGISVCDEWQKDFRNFLKWSLENGYREDLTIDRIDNNGNYEPSNCRWATHKQQQNNTRWNKRLEYNGEVKTLSEWCDLLNLSRSAITYRLSKGYSIKEAFEKPIKEKRK